MSARALALALMVTGCANAGTPGVGGGDDAPIDAPNGKHDANVAPNDSSSHSDAAVDAFVATDAAPDAPSGPFCANNSQCTNAGECCVTLGGAMGFCAPGTVVLGQCLPSQ